ncbi:cystin-1 isoform X3 [Octodon degus]|uniref:Cystin-1 isoform X3 n=1 Tax=Octodon degus TaxID=10160 RepID=A0A6P6DDI5_OCTDE|nr:cystin-1 isoform X3 [Octodon degus]
MGSGSSRSLRAQRRRGSHSPAAPEHRSAAAATVVATADAAAPAPAPAPAPGSAPAAPPDGRSEALRLLDLLLAESAAWGAQAPAGSPPESPRQEPQARHKAVIHLLQPCRGGADGQH